MLVLGSASPRRAALLREMGVPFTVCVSDVPETPLPGETPAEFARRAALDKGDAVARLLPGRVGARRRHRGRGRRARSSASRATQADARRMLRRSGRIAATTC